MHRWGNVIEKLAARGSADKKVPGAIVAFEPHLGLQKDPLIEAFSGVLFGPLPPKSICLEKIGGLFLHQAKEL